MKDGNGNDITKNELCAQEDGLDEFFGKEESYEQEESHPQEKKQEAKSNVAEQNSKSMFQKRLDYFSEVPEPVDAYSYYGTFDLSILDGQCRVVNDEFSTTRNLLHFFATSGCAIIDSVESFYKDYDYQYEEITEDLIIECSSSDDENNSDRDRSISYKYPSDSENSNEFQPSDAVDPDDASEFIAMWVRS